MKVFISFDERHDRDLYQRFIEQSRRPGASFDVVRDQSTAMRAKGWSEHPRGHIRSADEVVFLCGEHTNESLRMSVELDITREEEKPYILVWGRRDQMCTKPEGALPADGMYSWTHDILESQMAATLRAAAPRVIPESYKRPPARSKLAAGQTSAQSTDEKPPREQGDS